jgi:hypothetical protein
MLIAKSLRITMFCVPAQQGIPETRLNIAHLHPHQNQILHLDPEAVIQILAAHIPFVKLLARDLFAIASLDISENHQTVTLNVSLALNAH